MTVPIGFEPQGEAAIPMSAKPMLKEVAPGYIVQTPLSFYGYNNSDDAYIFNVANQYLITKYGGGEVKLAPMVFNGLSQAVPTWGANPASTTTGGNVSVIGEPGNTIWQSRFNGAAWFCHRTAGYGTQYGNLAQPLTGCIRGFTIDGQFVTGASAIGLDIGDGWNGIFPTAQMGVVNFDNSGQIGVNSINRVGTAFWTEKNEFVYKLSNNTTAMVIDNTAGNNSHEYNHYRISLFAQTLQQGIVVQNGCNVAGCKLYVRGNMAATSSSGGTPTNNLALLTVTGAGSRLYQTQMFSKVEGNPGNGSGTTFPWQLFSDGNGRIQQCYGQWGGSLNDIQMNGAEFSFSGPLPGCLTGAQLKPTLAGGTSSSQPGVPGSTVAFTNTGPDCNVNIAGGTVSNIGIGGVSTGSTSGEFFIRAGANLVLTYTVAPTTFIWSPAANSQG